MIDIKTEKLIALDKAREDVLAPGRDGRPMHRATLIKAIKAGDLDGVRCNSHWFTTVEAVQRWLDRQTAEALGKTPVPAPSAVARRKAAERAAGRLLDEAGIK